MRLLSLLTLLPLLAAAEPWQDYVRARAVAGADDLTIRSELVRPSVVLTTNLVVVAKPAAQVELEQATISAVASLVALVAPQVPPEERLTRVAGMKAKQLRDVIRAKLPELTVANQREVHSLILELQTYYAAAPEIWPPSPDFGQDTREVAQVTRSPGPSRWDTLRPVDGDPTPPTLTQIRAAMQAGGNP